MLTNYLLVSGSDERDCPLNSMTSFESGGVGLWGKGVNANWRVVQASSFSSLRDGPTYDHTTAYQRGGSFLYARARTLGRNNVSVLAQIDSPPFTPANRDCWITFFVYKNTPGSRLLAVLQDVHTGQRYELAEIGFSSYKWVRYSYRVYASSSSLYRAIFTATLNASQADFSQPYLAIDDIR